jgi:hypothetical protein
MKLSENHIPDECIIPDNVLYEHFQREFLNALSGPPDREPKKEVITPEAYDYNLEPAEEEFYEKIFVPASLHSLSDHDFALQEIFKYLPAEEGKHKIIDKNVKDLLDFIELKDRVLVLTAPVGWGKTVLIQYVWKYVIHKSEWLKKHVFPIHILVDMNISAFQGYDSKREIRQALYSNLIKERLIDITIHYTSLDDESFWTYLKTNTDRFNSLEQEEDDLHSKYNASLKGQRAKLELGIKEARSKAREQDDFYLFATKYVIEKKGKTVLLILDNVDPLSITINQVILEEAIELSRKYSFKVLVSMRKNTFNALSRDVSGLLRAYPPRRLEMESRNVKEYLRGRMNTIKNQLIQDSDGKPPSFVYLYEGEKKINFEDACKVIFSLTDVLLGEESSRILSNISHRNLRKLNRYLIKYLSTGYFDVDKLVTTIVKEQTTEEKTRENPLWILLASIITGNYATHFQDRLTQEYEAHVLNVYCNGDKSYNRYILRIHILNFLNKKDHINTSSKQLCTSYQEMIGTNPDDLNEQINYAIMRFLKCDLVESANYYDVNQDDIPTNFENLCITDTGRYYLTTFRNYYEYLIYMKDDVDLRENPYGIRDCVEVKSLEERYTELYKFLNFLVDEENNFLIHLNDMGKKVYLADFACHSDGSSSIFHQTIHDMIRFGNDRGLLRHTINQYDNLLTRIISYSFLKS